jgi:hypothetical protein
LLKPRIHPSQAFHQTNNLHFLTSSSFETRKHQTPLNTELSHRHCNSPHYNQPTGESKSKSTHRKITINPLKNQNQINARWIIFVVSTETPETSHGFHRPHSHSQLWSLSHWWHLHQLQHPVPRRRRWNPRLRLGTYWVFYLTWPGLPSPKPLPSIPTSLLYDHPVTDPGHRSLYFNLSKSPFSRYPSFDRSGRRCFNRSIKMMEG